MAVPGDFNQDGKLDAQDLAFLRQLLAENPEIMQNLADEDKALLDINRDGIIDREDLTLLCAKILNQPYSNPNLNSKLSNLRNKLSQ